MTWNLDRIATAFGDAAVDPTRWNAAMEVVAQETAGFGAALFAHSGALPDLPRSEAMLPSFEAYFDQGWVRRDDRYSALALMLRNGVVTDFDVASPDDIARRPYYQEFLAPFGLRWFAGVKVAGGANAWILSIQRTIAQGPFAGEELHRLGALSNRLSAAAAMAQALGLARAEGALDAFQASGTAAALFDRAGEVFRLNAAAEALLDADIQVTSRKLVSRSRDATARLNEAIRQLLWSRPDMGIAAPVVLPREPRRPVIAYPMGLTALARDYMASAFGAVVLIDLEKRAAPDSDILRRVFRLTPAEAGLTILLCRGESLERAAEALQVRYETARNQLKSVFSKTGTRRQAELVAVAGRLLLRHPC